MEEAKCYLVREMLCCQGHSHLRCPPVRHGCCTPARGMCEDEDDQPFPRRSVSVADISVAEAKRSLESYWNHAPAPILPLMSILARPPMSSLRKDTSIADLTGRHLDASRQSRRDLAKRAPSPAEQEQKKKARTPSTEEEDETDEMVRHSQEQRQERQWSRARSQSHNRRRRKARSRARAEAAQTAEAEATAQKELLHPCRV